MSLTAGNRHSRIIWTTMSGVYAKYVDLSSVMEEVGGGGLASNLINVSVAEASWC
jgi:hypothetical protein